VVRVTDIPSDKHLQQRYIRAKIAENDVHLQVARELQRCLADEEAFVQARYNAIERMDVAASGLVAAATAEATAGVRYAADYNTDDTEHTDSVYGGEDGEEGGRGDPGPASGVTYPFGGQSTAPSAVELQRSPTRVRPVFGALEPGARPRRHDPATLDHADELWVQVVGAVNLPATDTISESTDGFVKVGIEGDPVGNDFRSKHVNKTLDPVWGAEFEFHLRDRLSDAPPCNLKVRQGMEVPIGVVVVAGGGGLEGGVGGEEMQPVPFQHLLPPLCPPRAFATAVFMRCLCCLFVRGCVCR
jgi:hypothetical protein